MPLLSVNGIHFMPRTCTDSVRNICCTNAVDRILLCERDRPQRSMFDAQVVIARDAGDLPAKPVKTRDGIKVLISAHQLRHMLAAERRNPKIVGRNRPAHSKKLVSRFSSAVTTSGLSLLSVSPLTSLHSVRSVRQRSRKTRRSIRGSIGCSNIALSFDIAPRYAAAEPARPVWADQSSFQAKPIDHWG